MAAVGAVEGEAKLPQSICNLFARKNPKPLPSYRAGESSKFVRIAGDVLTPREAAFSSKSIVCLRLRKIIFIKLWSNISGPSGEPTWCQVVLDECPQSGSWLDHAGTGHCIPELGLAMAPIPSTFRYISPGIDAKTNGRMIFGRGSIRRRSAASIARLGQPDNLGGRHQTCPEMLY